ncbi:hypothetical protein BDY24DRAFT_276849 [Mrakia frigida]|uniref:uncharacterized protein n=1 Tax=Mrakia frigida TaxID=29902 RepID=UPI003FCBFB6A
MLALSSALLLASLVNAQAGVISSGPNGPTNPAAPSLDTPVNQTSMSRLVSLNSYDDFCLWGPPVAGDTIGDTEGEQVAWCTKPRNDARVIPDGTITSVHVVKTPNYIQIQGLLDGTKMNIMAGDQGGELDPHGATGEGNPVGGNVTSNVSGADVFYEEWMSFMSVDMFCLRICTAENSTYSAAIMCQHEIDLLGCQWVMPGDYTDDSFTTCDADAAYPPGVYPQPDGSTSTFHQRFTVTGTAPFTIGVTVTPSAAYSIPASSNCVTHTSPSNGLAAIVTAAVSSGVASASGAAITSGTGTGAAASGSGTKAAAGVSSGASATGAAASATGTTASSSAVRGESRVSFSSAMLVLGAMVLGGGALAI